MVKFSLRSRLFLSVLLSIWAVAAIGVELVRWRLFDNFAQYAANVELERLDELVDHLAAQYRVHHDWSFVPTDATQRKSWLRDTLATHAGNRPFSPSLGYRLGLLDENRRYLAGALANRIIIVVASIDRRERNLLVDGRVIGHLVVAKPQNPDDDLAVAFLVQQQHNLVIVMILGVLLSALAAALLAAHFGKPIRQLAQGARRLGKAQFDTRLQIRRSDELGELALTFNQLATTLENSERSRQQWMADTSHELRTPLSVLRAQMESLQDGIRTATPENVALMLRQVLSLTKLVDELSELARSDVGPLQYAMQSVVVWPIAEELFAGFADKLAQAELTATIGPPPARSNVHGDPERIRQVLTNLLENCVRYSDAGGRLELRGAVDGPSLRITLDDSAPAVPEAALARLGERFFRVEASRSRQSGGSGLGLALCKQMLEAHGGQLEFSASPLGGLRAIVILPLENS